MFLKPLQDEAKEISSSSSQTSTKSPSLSMTSTHMSTESLETKPEHTSSIEIITPADNNDKSGEYLGQLKWWHYIIIILFNLFLFSLLSLVIYKIVNKRLNIKNYNQNNSSQQGQSKHESDNINEPFYHLPIYLRPLPNTPKYQYKAQEKFSTDSLTRNQTSVKKPYSSSETEDNVSETTSIALSYDSEMFEIINGDKNENGNEVGNSKIDHYDNGVYLAFEHKIVPNFN